VQVAQVARRVATAIRGALGAPGMKLHQVPGVGAGEDVLHFHVHLIPRTRGDGVLPVWDRRRSGRRSSTRSAATRSPPRSELGRRRS
jgi:diadenosine tetraphosphate (Ap4A) HIT family hydrolase